MHRNCEKQPLRAADNRKLHITIFQNSNINIHHKNKTETADSAHLQLSFGTEEVYSPGIGVSAQDQKKQGDGDAP